MLPESTRAARPSWRAVLVAGAAAVAWVAVAHAVLQGPKGFLDLLVYRAGGRAWLTGVPLYGAEFPALVGLAPLPFTYPPVAAVLFAPLAAVPLPVATAALTGAGLAALAVTGWLAAARLVPTRHVAAALAAAAVVLGTASEPVRETLTFGQVNLVLMGLVAADCLLPRTPWPRGLLVGLAAAVKLTPAVFVLYFLGARQWRPAVVAVAAAVAATLVGLLAAPRSSWQYWTSVLGDPARIGQPAFAGNQSLRGFVLRLGAEGGAATACWIAGAVAVAGLAAVAVHGLRGRGDDVGALLAVAAAGLLASPVSWTHHWVWAVPAVVWLAVRARRPGAWGARAGLGAAVAVFGVGPHWFFSDRDDAMPDWGPGEQLLGNAYVLLGTALLLALAVLARTRGPRPAPPRGAGAAQPESPSSPPVPTMGR